MIKTIIFIVSMTNYFGDNIYTETSMHSMEACMGAMDRNSLMFKQIHRFEAAINLYPKSVLRLDYMYCKVEEN